MSTNQNTQQAGASSETESTISAKDRKRLQQWFERAKQLAEKDEPDFDYILDLYAQCVVDDPSNLVYVEAFLENLQRKYKNNKKRGGFWGFGGSRKAFQKAVLAKDWKEVFREGINLLKTNLWDVPTLRALAEACAVNHYNEVELAYLKIALDAKPKDAEVNKHCARSLARMGQFDQSIACWQRVKEITGDTNIDKFMSQLTLAKTMGGSLSEEVTGPLTRPPASAARPAAAAGSPEESSAPAAESTAAQDAAGADRPDEQDSSASTAEPAEPRREIKLNVRQTVERALRQDPTNADLYVQLAEINSSERRYHDAEAILKKGLESAGSSLKLLELYEDAQIRSARARAMIAEKRAAVEKNVDAHELVKKLKDDLNRLELDIYQTRAQRHPEHRRYQFELAVRLRRAANYREAIKWFQDSRREPGLFAAATVEMGECFQQLKQYGKALECYQAAIEKAPEKDEDSRKTALYRAAILEAAMKHEDVAKKYLTELIQLDPFFRDAQHRLDKLP